MEHTVLAPVEKNIFALKKQIVLYILESKESKNNFHSAQPTFIN